ncbi:MAG: hypothetical protein OCD76_04240 [Reichenbachiella sp.]
MQRFITFILFIGIVIHIFYSSGFLLDYYLNSSFYIENCENKDEPVLQCDGKCILAQKLAEAESNSNENQGEFIPPLNIEFVISNHVAEAIEHSVATTENNITFYHNHYLFLLVDKAIIPPQG